MNIMITPIFRTLMIILGLGLFACSSSKFRYQDAYQFSNYNYQKSPPVTGQDQYFEPLASTNPDFNPVTPPHPKLAIPKMDVREAYPAEKLPLKQTKSKLTRKEKKAFKQNIRHQLKEVLKEKKALKKEAKNKKAAMNRKVYSGLIVAGAGLIVAILVSGTIGGLAIIIGVALIAWGLIEEGSI